ncbi:unnamed protein product, partial [Pylaiella littoralis]
GSRSSAGDGKVPGPDEPQPSGGDSSSTAALGAGARRTGGEGEVEQRDEELRAAR